MVERLIVLWRTAARVARLMVGVPDYDDYLARRRHCAPGAAVLSREAFVRRCAERRLGGRGPRGCC